MSPRFSLHGRIGDCTRELGANRTPQPSPPPPPKRKKKHLVIRLLKREYLPLEFKSDIVKVTNYRWKEIFSLLFKNPSRVIFFSMWEKENFYQATCFLSTDSSVTEFWEWCRNQLRAFYNTMCQVKITPWDPDNTVHINDIYIQVTFLQDHRKPDGTTKKKLGDSSEVFEGDEHHPIRRRILVYGRPGIGKSTFTQKVAVDWANGRKKILEKFNLLLLIRLRDVCGISDLCTMLKTAELLSADDPMAVNNLCEYVRQNQEKVLLILDGYDEYSGGKSSLIHQIWRGSQLRDCCVMITTRPVKEDELRVPSHAQFELNGFDSWEQKKQFASKILPDEEDVEGLLEYLRKHDLEEMAEIPLLLLMLCLLWKKKKPQLPTSRAEIYVEFIQTLLDHMAIKDSDNVATDKSIDEYQEELSKIGKLAFDALQMISFLSGVASTLSKCSVMLEFLSYQHPVNCNLQQVNHLKVM